MIRKHHKHSPSSLERQMECPGSFAICANLPMVPQSEDATEGEMLHRAVETGIIPDGFTEEQRATAERCIVFEKELSENCQLIEKEQRMYLYDQNGDIINYGYADCVIVRENGELVVIDWKFGRNPVETAKDNIQLACLAAMAMHRQLKNECTVYVVQPRLGRFNDKFTFTNGQSIVDFIQGVVSGCYAENAPLKHGKHCNYCPAMHWGTCPEVGAVATSLAEKSPDVSENIALMPPEDLEKLYKAGKIVSRLSKKVEERIKEVCASKGSCGNLCLKVISGGWHCENINAAFDLLADKISADEFLSCCVLSVSSLAALFAKKQKDAGDAKNILEGKEMFFELLSDVITQKNNKTQITE